MANQESKPTLIKYWPIILAVVTIAISWGVSQAKQISTDERISKVETRQANIDMAQTQILVQLGNIQTDLGWVKQALIKQYK